MLKTVAIGAVIAALGVAGCGGSPGAGPASESSCLTRDQVAAQVDRIIHQPHYYNPDPILPSGGQLTPDEKVAAILAIQSQACDPQGGPRIARRRRPGRESRSRSSRWSASRREP